jgi:fibronectin type 3 domain-containing protein
MAPLMRYRIYRNVDSTDATLRDSTTAVSYINTGLTPGTRYFFRVSAVDSTGFEGSRSYAVGCVAGDVTAPASPQSLAVTDSSSRSITVKWRKNIEPDFLRYRVYQGTSPNPTTKVHSTTAWAAAETSKTFTGLTNGTRYYLRVTAVDSSANESPYSNEVDAMPADRQAPSVPQNLVVTDSSSTTITIKWRKNTESDFLRYRIYRGTSPNPTTKVDSTTAGAADTSKTFASLTNGTRYYLRVTAVDSAGNESAYSNEVSAVPNIPSGVDDLLSQIPKDFSLAQNYPNPFNPNTVIRYGLPVRSHVRLEIFNMLGQRVALLADEEQDAHYYEKTWQAEGASGLYFYRLETVASDDVNRRYVEVRKMLLVK